MKKEFFTDIHHHHYYRCYTYSLQPMGLCGTIPLLCYIHAWAGRQRVGWRGGMRSNEFECLTFDLYFLQKFFFFRERVRKKNPNQFSKDICVRVSYILYNMVMPQGGTKFNCDICSVFSENIHNYIGIPIEFHGCLNSSNYVEILWEFLGSSLKIKTL